MNSVTSELQVSAIIPTVGRESLVTAIKSCQFQTIPFQEIIVVDDSAKQNVLAETQKSHQCKVTVLRTGGKRGANHARNLGLAVASTRHVTFLDDDDFFLPHRNASIRASSNILTVHGSLIYDEVTGAMKFAHQPVGKYTWTRLLRGNIAGAAPILPRLLAEEAGGFDESIRRGQDWDFNIRCSRITGEFEVLPIQSHISCVSTQRSRISNQSNPWRQYAGILAKHQEHINLHTRVHWFAKRLAEVTRIKRLG